MSCYTQYFDSSRDPITPGLSATRRELSGPICPRLGGQLLISRVTGHLPFHYPRCPISALIRHWPITLRSRTPTDVKSLKRVKRLGIFVMARVVKPSFDTLGNGTEPMWGSSPPQQLADRMHAAWVAFAKNGRCSWPKYDVTRRATMRFDITCDVVDDPRSRERALWEGGRTKTTAGERG